MAQVLTDPRTWPPWSVSGGGALLQQHQEHAEGVRWAVGVPVALIVVGLCAWLVWVCVDARREQHPTPRC